jgi:hypothetical protein
VTHEYLRNQRVLTFLNLDQNPVPPSATFHVPCSYQNGPPSAVFFTADHTYVLAATSSLTKLLTLENEKFISPSSQFLTSDYFNAVGEEHQLRRTPRNCLGA